MCKCEPRVDVARLIFLSGIVMKFKTSSGVPILIGAALVLGGCTLAPSAAERQANDKAAQIGSFLRPRTERPTLPKLSSDSPFSDYVRYAALNHPEVQAAYLEWRASLSAVAPNRALPDPQFTFQADIADTVMSLMPGLMFDVMTPGKRRAMTDEALGSANVAYREYVAAVFKVTARVRKAAIELAYVDDAVRLRDQSIALLDQATDLASSAYSTGAGMATLETQVLLANDVAKIRAEIAALGDRQRAARAQFKAALGLLPSDPDPDWPRLTLAPTVLPTADELWARARLVNPEIGRMRAMVEMAVAGVQVARKTGTPDFTVGAMPDLKADPLMIRPTATITLPVWREKIRATISAAEARRDAAAARVTAEEVNLAAEIAQMLYMVRESDLMIGYIEKIAIPNYDRVIASVEASYQSGMGSPAMIPQTRVMQVGMRLERLSALRDRENAVTDLLLMTADTAAGAADILVDNSSQ